MLNDVERVIKNRRENGEDVSKIYEILEQIIKENEI